jgi:hypothetical protein
VSNGLINMMNVTEESHSMELSVFAINLAPNCIKKGHSCISKDNQSNIILRWQSWTSNIVLSTLYISMYSILCLESTGRWENKHQATRRKGIEISNPNIVQYSCISKENQSSIILR